MKKLLVVGGAGRNVGKTEFACRLIEKVSTRAEIYALKVSAIFPDEELYHGDHSEEGRGTSLFEETRSDTAKDTSRMLRAGAARVFYLRSDEAGIAAGFSRFLQQVPKGCLIVCESNSLASVVSPALHVVVKAGHGEVKPRARALLEIADLVVISDGKSGFTELDRISVDIEGGWRLI